MQLELKIFVAQDCPGCVEAHEIAAHIERDHPSLDVEMVDITDKESGVPDMVFATPTYMLNNRIVSLGNPKPEEIARWAENGPSSPSA